VWTRRLAAVSHIAFQVHVEAVLSRRQSGHVARDKDGSPGVGLREEDLTTAAPAFSVTAPAAKDRQGHHRLEVLQSKHIASNLIRGPYLQKQLLWVMSLEYASLINLTDIVPETAFSLSNFIR
jgi:hypothetical protein